MRLSHRLKWSGLVHPDNPLQQAVRQELYPLIVLRALELLGGQLTLSPDAAGDAVKAYQLAIELPKVPGESVVVKLISRERGAELAQQKGTLVL